MRAFVIRNREGKEIRVIDTAHPDAASLAREAMRQEGFLSSELTIEMRPDAAILIDAQSNEEVIRQLDDPKHPIGDFAYAVDPDSGRIAASIGWRVPFVELVEMLCHE